MHFVICTASGSVAVSRRAYNEESKVQEVQKGPSPLRLTGQRRPIWLPWNCMETASSPSQGRCTTSALTWTLCIFDRAALSVQHL